MANKLNSMRLLDSKGIKYDVLTYDDTIHDAVDAAAKLGVPAEQLYKTLVVERVALPKGSKPVLVMIAANRQLDLKKFAAAIGEKKVNMASHDDAERMTGLKVGGIGALALVQKNWAVYIDRPALELDAICVSAGQRGVNLRVPTKDLIGILGAKPVDATIDRLPS